MTDKKSEKPLTRYRTGKLTLLEMMGLLAVLGIVLTLVLRHYFG